MLRKLKNKQGSAMSLAIILIVLVSIVGSSITMMVTRQINFSYGNSKNTDLKYEVEAGVENVIATFIEDINEELEITRKKKPVHFTKYTEIRLLRSYVKLIEDLLVDNKQDPTIKSILHNLKNGKIQKKDMETMVDKLGELEDIAKQKNINAGQLTAIAKDYAEFFRDNFFKGESLDLSNLNLVQAKDLIVKVMDNLSLELFLASNKVENNGNVGVVYRDVTSRKNSSNKVSYFKPIYEKFKSNGEIVNLINELKELKTDADIKAWANKKVGSTTKANNLVNKIYETEYDKNIKEEKHQIHHGGYLNTTLLMDYYFGDNYDKKQNNKKLSHKTTHFVKDRLEIVKQEIDVLAKWLSKLAGIDIEETEDDLTNGVIQINVPSESKVSNNIKTTSITVSEKSDLQPTTTNSEKYIFEVSEDDLGTEIILNLKIESSIDDYTIESEVEVNINEIVSEDDYNVDYEVKTWNKK